jgi:hypothetical protein
MFCCSPRLFRRGIFGLCLALVCSIIAVAFLSASSLAQRGAQAEAPPAFSDFKGVRIGTAVDEARKKLGSPREKSDEQDFYVFNDNQAVQIYYDKGKTVSAISIDFMSGGNIPTCKDILGADEPAKQDGSLYKIMRYPKAGYWVSYSRTAGDAPTVTITMQKIDH